MQSPYVRLAVQSFTYYLKTGKPMQIPDVLPEELTNKQAGAFVTLYKNGNLRGCIGTINPIRNSLAEEIIMNAISAAFRDPRFPPITADELPDIVCSVDVLETPEPVSDMRTLDVKHTALLLAVGIDAVCCYLILTALTPWKNR